MAWTQKVLDHFTDTPLTLLTSHTPDVGSGWTFDSGSGRINVDGDVCQVTSSGFLVNQTVLANDQAVEMTLLQEPVWIFLRYDNTGGGRGYLLEGRDGLSLRLWKVAAGDPRPGSPLGTGGTGAVNDVLRLEAVGTGLTVLQNGSTVFTATDSSYTAGKAGIYACTRGDDFAAYEVAGGGGVLPQAYYPLLLGGGGQVPC